MTISIFEDNDKLRDLIEMLIGSSNEFVVKGYTLILTTYLTRLLKINPM